MENRRMQTISVNAAGSQGGCDALNAMIGLGGR
jgi:hypothetical protein